MPFKRKGSPYWWAVYTDATGKRVRRTTGTTDLRAAEALESKWRAEIYQQRHWGEQPKRSFEEVMTEFLRYAQRQRSFETTQHRIRRLRKSFGGFCMHDLKAKEIRAYIREREDDGVSPSTINRELAAMSSAINHCNREHEWELPNPVKGRMVRESEGRERYLTYGEIGRLVTTARQQKNGDLLADFILLAVNTGCRRNEMLGLEWGRVDLASDQPVLRLEGRHTKSGKRRTVPLNDEARNALMRRKAFCAAHCPASPWVFARASGERAVSVRNGFIVACKRAGIEDMRIHDLRHTAASWMITEGAPLEVVKELLGHSSITMTERYAHLAPHRVREAVNRLGAQKCHSKSPVHLIRETK